MQRDCVGNSYWNQRRVADTVVDEQTMVFCGLTATERLFDSVRQTFFLMGLMGSMGSLGLLLVLSSCVTNKKEEL